MGKRRSSAETVLTAGSSLSLSSLDGQAYKEGPLLKRRRVDHGGRSESSEGMSRGRGLVEEEQSVERKETVAEAMVGSEIELEEEEAEDRRSRMDSESDEDSEADEEALQRELELARKRGFADVGILEKVKVYNFMCHSCFEFSFGPNVNIVNGRNGSGKSAIVAALQVGLGAKARSTERGQKLADHIMLGKSSALISIKIKNRPPADENSMNVQYKPDVFGNSITIERRLARGGSGGWAVKDEKGKNVKLEKGRTARQEVTEIVDYFGFQVDNPVSVLTQTKSKEFLQSGKSTDRYKFFMESTRLGELNDKINSIRRMADEVATIVKQKEAVAPVVAKQLEELKTAFEDAQEMKTINERIEQAELEYAWTVADEKAAPLERYKEATHKFEKDAAAAALAKEHLEKEVERLNSSFEAAQAELEVLTRQVEESQAAQRRLNKAVSSAEYELKTSKKQRRRKDDEINRCLRNKKEAEERLEQERRKHTEKAASANEIARAHQDTLAELQGTEGAIQQAEEAEQNLFEKQRRLREEGRRLQSSVSDADWKYRNAQKELDGLTGPQRRNVARWRDDMPDILRHIGEAVRARQFHRPPIGPLGEHISLLDKTWARAVQVALGRRFLCSFLVNDVDDLHLLKSIFRRVTRTPPDVIITKLSRRRYYVRRSDLPAVHADGHVTMLDVLKIDSDAVFNALIDQKSVDTHVLLRESSLMRSYAHRQIRNMSMCWDPSGARAYSRSGSRVYRANPERGAPIVLTSSMEELIANKKAQVRHLRGVLDSARSELEVHNQSFRAADQEYNKARSWKLELRQRVTKLKMKLQDLDEQLSGADGEFDSSAFDDEIGALSHEVVQAEQEKSALLAKLDELQKRVDVAVEAANKHKHNSSALRRSNREKSEELEEQNVEVGRMKAALRNKSRELEQLEKKVNAAHLELGLSKNEHRTAVDEANQLGPRPENMEERDSTTIQGEIKAMKERMDNERDRHDGKSVEQLEAEWLHAQKKEKENKRALAKVRQYAVALHRGHKRRRHEGNRLYRSILVMSRHAFKMFLSSRGHKGEMKCSDGELRLTVRMANHKVEGTSELYETRDLRSLSGGERSYTTLAFMLALGNSMEVSTRVMDEFDVFMDEANRRAAYATLIELCRTRLSDKQFIFITPLALPNIKPCDAVRVQRLNPPRGDPRTHGVLDRMLMTQ